MTSLIKIRPKSVEPYVWRAESKRLLEKFEEALLDLDTAIINKPGATITNGEVLGVVELNYTNPYIKNENYDLELEHIYYQRGVILVRLERYQESIPALDYVVDKIPNDKDARWHRGIALLHLGYLEKGCEDLQLSPEFTKTYSKDLFNKYCNRK